MAPNLVGGDNLSDGAHKGRTSRAAHGEREAIRVESTDAPAPTSAGSPGRARAGDEVEGALRALMGRDSDTDNPEMLLIIAERRARVFEAVRGLAPERRELVSRVFGINRPAQSVRSVADAWGAPKSRVDRMLARTLADLRELLDEREH
ncbi:hypothetical protein [Hyalangium versicolor]|uniref:hypothetical protein n=1 Tax=Hyalangium versicolor TaxID=2861190 RepID=UPI001CCB50E4|nr:hypothetical protein [Hyalangium versicolor]